MSAKTSHEFRAEVSQVLHLVVHSLYTKKEIFLRELISNASDALDKRKFRALTDASLSGPAPKITIESNEKDGTLTLSDNGIGMSEAELVENLGTIARSGTREFSENLKQAGQVGEDLSQLIGQFGVGFYSAFLVAERVEVLSRAAGATEAFRWESDAKSAFTIERAERAEPGTTIILHLKEEESEYAKPWRLREVVRKHSDYVGHPIELVVPAEKEGDEPKRELLNQGSALWQRNPKEVTNEQYAEFYKHLAHDWEEPLAHRHFRIEGTQLFSGIVYLPRTSRSNLLDPRAEHGVRLHVRRVLAMESCEELLPKWLRFARGVVDSEDLPLNVSRETLQDSRIIKIIRKQVVSNILSMLEELQAERPADYLTFWKNFGTILKEGLYFEPDLEERLAKLCLFATTHREARFAEAEGLTTLEAYVERMKPEQAGIYYIEGADEKVLLESAHLERLRAGGIEVLLMSDSVDPFALEKLTSFHDKKLLNAAKADLELGELGKSDHESTDALTEAFQSALGERVSAVKNSQRLAESPACLVTPESGLAPHLEAMFRAQNLEIPRTRRVLEVNPDHPLIADLRKLQLVHPDAPELRDYMELVYDQALIAEGSQVEDPPALARRVQKLLGQVARARVEDA